MKEFHGSLGADFCQQRLQFSSLRATSVTNWSETGRHCRDASKRWESHGGMKNISVQQLATLKLLHIVVMTTPRQCRSGFKHLQDNRRRWKRKRRREGGVTSRWERRQMEHRESSDLLGGNLSVRISICCKTTRICPEQIKQSCNNNRKKDTRKP